MPPREDHLSEYERAVCYYSLPRAANPVTLGLLIAYAICLLEAIAALTYGLVESDAVWTKWGIICFAAIIVFGVIVFLVRATINEVRQRRLLESAHQVPDEVQSRGLPDPFAGHVLLRISRGQTGAQREITDNTGRVHYRVYFENHGKLRKVAAEGASEGMDVEIMSNSLSFGFDAGFPSRVRVRRGNDEVAALRKRRGLGLPKTEIVTGGWRLIARGRGLYDGERLVGRVYFLRQYLYLDVQEAYCNDGVLSFFVALA
jgi:hypothetical protein